MLFNTPANNALFVKVNVKTKPYSAEPVSIRVFAHTFEQFTVANAICYSELPIHSSTTLALVQAKIAEFQQTTNTAHVYAKFQPKVLKLITPDVA
jgi:hypothetical protein